MGCFNATCSVTKLPILNNEKCVLIVFRKPSEPIDSSITRISNIATKVTNDLCDVVFGKYDNYGGIVDKEVRKYDHILNNKNNGGDNDDYQSFFISHLAWEFGKTIEETYAYKFDPFNSLEFGIKALQLFLKLKDGGSGEIKYTEIISQLKKEFKFEKEAKVIYYLYNFLSQNLIEMFDLSWNGRTSGQVTYVDSIQKFNNLRTLRLQKLTENEEFYDGSKEVLAY